MNITEEDRVQYNLIEDINNSKIIGTASTIIEYLNDMIEYNLNNTDDELSIKDIKKTIGYIEYALKENIDENTIIAIFENPMCGLDWQIVDYC